MGETPPPDSRPEMLRRRGPEPVARHTAPPERQPNSACRTEMKATQAPRLDRWASDLQGFVVLTVARSSMAAGSRGVSACRLKLASKLRGHLTASPLLQRTDADRAALRTSFAGGETVRGELTRGRVGRCQRFRDIGRSGSRAFPPAVDDVGARRRRREAGARHDSNRGSLRGRRDEDHRRGRPPATGGGGDEAMRRVGSALAPALESRDDATARVPPLGLIG